MTRQNKSCFDIEQIFGKPIEQVDSIIANMDSHVKKIQIPKRDGSKRNILAPSKELKYIQTSLYWKFFKRYKPHDAAHGFVPKKGISTNAEPHVGAKSMGKIDVSSFFDTISENHLKNCLFGNRQICRECTNYERMLDGGCHPSLYKNATENFEFKCDEMKAVWIPEFIEEMGYNSLFERIIKVCTYKGFTAQGFPTSPVIANIVMRGFDNNISKYCEEQGIQYTRYADDLAFSSLTHTKKELKKIIKKKVYSQLWAFNFEPNKKKTMFKSNTGRLKICGVVVNEKKNVQRSVVHRFRAKVHHATVISPEDTTKKRLKQLKGWASFLMSINPSKGKLYMDKLTSFENIKFPKAA